jgi:Fic family protein
VKSNRTSLKISLNTGLDQLLAEEGGFVTSVKAKKLMQVVLDTANATLKMVEAGKVVMKKSTDSDAQMELTNTARDVGACIKNTLDAAKVTII